MYEESTANHVRVQFTMYQITEEVRKCHFSLKVTIFWVYFKLKQVLKSFEPFLSIGTQTIITRIQHFS
jgi:hypothetical protein